jgi:excisionase family DNA binding protein
MNGMLTLGEAAEFLGVSRKKMWSLVKEKVISPHTSPLDRRKKLFKKSDLEKLKEAFA